MLLYELLRGYYSIKFAICQHLLRIVSKIYNFLLDCLPQLVATCTQADEESSYNNILCELLRLLAFGIARFWREVAMGTVVTTLAQWFKKEPQIAAEWDGAANPHIDPEIAGYSVNLKAWWICPAGHHYDAWVYARTIDGQGCPYCRGKRALSGFNDLATTRPDVLTKWDFEKNTELTPKDVTEFSHKKVWWKCEKGHSWQARVQSVTMLKDGASGCPCCNGLAAAKGETDLATLRPDLAAQWCYEKNELTPEEVTPGSKRKVFWQCEKGHTWEAVISARTGVERSGCPYCSGKAFLSGFNDLATMRPDVAAEWNYEKNEDLTPRFIKYTSREEKVWWKCAEGHEWQTTVYARTKKNGTNCPICSRKKK